MRKTATYMAVADSRNATSQRVDRKHDRRRAISTDDLAEKNAFQETRNCGVSINDQPRIENRVRKRCTSAHTHKHTLPRDAAAAIMVVSRRRHRRESMSLTQIQSKEQQQASERSAHCKHYTSMISGIQNTTHIHTHILMCIRKREVLSARWANETENLAHRYVFALGTRKKSPVAGRRKHGIRESIATAHLFMFIIVNYRVLDL